MNDFNNCDRKQAREKRKAYLFFGNWIIRYVVWDHYLKYTPEKNFVPKIHQIIIEITIRKSNTSIDCQTKNHAGEKLNSNWMAIKEG